MNVASLELCKELYELSGWGEYGQENVTFWYKFGEKVVPRSYIGKDTVYLNSFPAYDLGYLLRKLPARVDNGGHANGSWFVLEKIMGAQEGDWVARYDTTHICHEDTPEDAACRLAVELFKQGILTNESGGRE